MSWIRKLRKLARKAGREALILWFAIGHPDTPLPLKLAAGAALGYLASPIDLLPDIVLIGLIDDVVLLSLGVPFLIRMLPERVRVEAERRADLVLVAMGLAPAPEPGRGGGRKGFKAAADRRNRSAPDSPARPAGRARRP